MPALTGGRIRSNLAVQTSRQREALISYQSAILNSLEELENALVSYSQEQERPNHKSDILHPDSSPTVAASARLVFLIRNRVLPEVSRLE